MNIYNVIIIYIKICNKMYIYINFAKIKKYFSMLFSYLFVQDMVVVWNGNYITVYEPSGQTLHSTGYHKHMWYFQTTHYQDHNRIRTYLYVMAYKRHESFLINFVVFIIRFFPVWVSCSCGTWRKQFIPLNQTASRSAHRRYTHTHTHKLYTHPRSLTHENTHFTQWLLHFQVCVL